MQSIQAALRRPCHGSCDDACMWVVCRKDPAYQAPADPSTEDTVGNKIRIAHERVSLLFYMADENVGRNAFHKQA